MQMFEYRFVGLALIVSVSLAGCMDGTGSTSSPRSGAGGSASAAERDVEDPRVFSKREKALWDGRPSLGGVWVAHPDVRSPERVIIRNTENGQETIGALFRRERMNPGPAFQVSGEAANAVGMLAGAPTMIEVVALRVEEAESAPPQADAESAAPAPQATPAPEAAPDTATATDDAQRETLIAMPEAEPEPRGGFFGRLFGRNRSEAAAEPSEIDTQPLGDTAPEPAADAPAGAPPAMPSPLNAPAASPAPTPTSAPASTLAQPFVQLGIFSVEANARNAESMASGAGLSARVVAGRAQGNEFWRVIVGPAANQADLNRNLARVKSLGFNDAYPVRR